VDLRFRRLALLAAVSLAISALSGCGAAGSPAASLDANPAGSRLVPGAVTIDALFGIPEVPSAATSREEELIFESLVAECMADKGWEYVPVVYPDDYYGYPIGDELERRQREGFNIVNYVLTHSSAETVVDPWEDWVDPNAAYLDSLSPDDWEAYHKALEGDVWVMTDTSSGFEGGCVSQAEDEVYSPLPEAGPNDFVIGEVKIRVTEVFDEQVQGDSRILAAEATWSACMRDAGYEFATRADLWAFIYGPGFEDRMTEILGDDFYQNPIDALSQEEQERFYDSATPEEIAALNDGVFPVSDEQRAALELLRADEIALAVAEYPCAVVYQAAYDEAHAAFEEEFVNKYRDEIEEAVEKAITEGLPLDWELIDGFA
jgi:hypothetical protein